MPGFIIDLDGTLYAGTRPILEAPAFIDFLRAQRYPLLFVTNNSSRTPEEVARHLHHVTGIAAQADEVLTSAQSAAVYIASHFPGGKAYMIGETGLREALLAAGIRLVDGAADQPDVVVQGIDRSFTYQKLATASTCLWQGAAFVATNPDLQLPDEHGLTPGSGSLTAAIEAASQVEPVVIGKPSTIIMQHAITRLGLPASDIWVVGDNLRTDIGGGMAAGCLTAWVRSGIGAERDAAEWITEVGIQPHEVCANLTEFVRIIAKRYGQG
jgi:4-nitrophenyl phosphatase